MSNMLFTPDSMLSHAESIESTTFARFNHAISLHDTSTLFCFVEGHDFPYYQIRIESISDKKCELIDSKGKKGVLNMYNFLKDKSEYDKYKILFFVDRDYDDNTNINNKIYVTPGYSVENFYGTIDCFKKIINGTYYIYEDNPKYDLCIKLYNKLSTDFINATSCFCAWYRCTKSKNKHMVKLHDSFPECYASFASSFIKKTEYDFNTLNEDYKDVENVTEEEYNQSVAYINNNIMNIRGKYIMQFIEFLIKILNHDSRNCKKYTDSKVDFESNRKTLIARLSAYADTPSCLREYILENM